MSILATDANSNPVQAFRMPRAGATQAITGVLNASTKTAAALPAGFYRVTSTAAVQVVSGVFATAVASAIDMPLAANQAEYFYINAGDTVAIFDAVGGAVVSLTLMP